MTEDELKAVIGRQIRSAIGSTVGSTAGSELAEQRRKALDYYYGDKFGNEVEGRSEVVLTDVADTVEWMLPSLIEVFMAGDEVVRFEPQYPEDEDAARQATEYVNHIFTVDNRGFTILYDMFKDALLQKVGIAKVWWEETEETKKESFSGLTDDDVALILSTEGVEPVASAQNELGLWDLTVERKTADGRVRIESVPPEEFLISRRATTILDSPFVAHATEKTVTELLEMGFDRETVEDLPAYSDGVWNTETTARHDFDTTQPFDLDAQTDRSMRPVMVYECYLKVDYDDDGRAERRKVTAAGSGFTILDNEEVDEVPFVSVCPVPMPHKFHGLSFADLTMDLQLISSTVMRQILDNAYNINNARNAVNERVDLDDLLTNSLGSQVRVSGEEPVEGSIMPLVTVPIGDQLFPVLEYLAQVRENRTGVSRYNQGLDPDALNDTAAGIGMLQNASMKKQALIARIFAETGVRDLFALILRLVVANQDRPRTIRLRNEWVPMDPRDWNAEMDVQIGVGLGHGNRDQQQFLLREVLNVQREIVGFQGGPAGPLVGLTNIYNTLDKLVQAGGFKSAEPFFMDPQGQQMQAPEPPPDPKLIEVQAKMQLEGMKAQNDAELKREEFAMKERQTTAEIELARFKAQMEAEVAVVRVQMENALRREQAGLEVEISVEKLVAELGMKQAQMQADMESKSEDMRLKRESAQFDAGLKERGVAMAEDGERRKFEAAQGKPVLDAVQEFTRSMAETIAKIDSALKDTLKEVRELKAEAAEPVQLTVKRDAGGRPVGGTRKQGKRETEITIN